MDGENFFVIEDKRDVTTDLSHDFLLRENGIALRYVKISQMSVPYEQKPCISGLRVFGNSRGELPEQADYQVERSSGIDMKLTIFEDDSVDTPVGYNILWGHKKDKLYHSYLTYERNQRVGALVEGQSYYVRVDTFNEHGITEGKLTFVE